MIGSDPVITVLQHSTEPLGIGYNVLLGGLQRFVEDMLFPAWKVRCTLASEHKPGNWRLILVNDADQAGTLGYHEQAADGTPTGFVCVRPTLANGEAVSVVCSHELAEMLVDPTGNLGVMSPRGRFVALEVCDAVEATTMKTGNGVEVSNFMYPAWFGLLPGRQYDALDLCKQPWQILDSGYMPVYLQGHWTQIFGSYPASERFNKEDRRLHRTERRVFKHIDSIKGQWSHSTQGTHCCRLC